MLPGITTEQSAAAFLPEGRTLDVLRTAASRCEGCDLYRYATQTVFGSGRAHAPLMFVGEQPGNDEDLAGEPFVGPAGKLLRQAFKDTGIDERDAYITNAVKHFKFVERGKRRIHQSPKRIEVKACRPWLEAEIEAIRPKLVVALGATAANSLMGPAFKLTPNRGKLVESELARYVIATVHPSSILRAQDDARADQMRAFQDDLRSIAAAFEKIRA